MHQLGRWVRNSLVSGPVTLLGEVPRDRTQTTTPNHSGASELSKLMQRSTAGGLAACRAFHQA